MSFHPDVAVVCPTSGCRNPRFAGCADSRLSVTAFALDSQLRSATGDGADAGVPAIVHFDLRGGWARRGEGNGQ
jgi:hypothetical protein